MIGENGKNLAKKESSTCPFLQNVLNESEENDKFQYPNGKSLCEYMCTSEKIDFNDKIVA